MVDGDPRAAATPAVTGASAARPSAKAKPTTYDDLDEDTRVLTRRQTSFEIDRGFEELSAAEPEILDESTDRAPKVVVSPKLAGAPLPAEAPAPSAKQPKPEETSLSVTASHPVGWKVPDAAFPDSSQTRTDLRAPVLDIPPPRPSAPVAAPKKAETSLAVRVALLATGTSGDVRVIAVEPGVAPPEGALVVWIVPASGEADAVLRLLGVEPSR